MSRILNLQAFVPIGVDRAGTGAEEAASTCSYLFCGSSTASCQNCCMAPSCAQTNSTF